MTVVWGFVIAVFPIFLPMFPWNQDDSNIGEFILLYLIVGCIKRTGGKLGRLLWLIIWSICVAGLAGSAIVLHKLMPKYEMFFYRYNSVIVIVEAVAVFMLFLTFEVKNDKIREAVQWAQGSSLVVYLLHMHPLFKDEYTKWRIFNYININSFWIYSVQVLMTVLVIFVAGTLIGKVVCRVADRYIEQIMNLIKYVIYSFTRIMSKLLRQDNDIRR